MPDQPHTPTEEEIQEQFEAGAMVTGFSYSRNEATIDWQLWLQERDARIEADAEQRGHLDGWDEVLELLENNSEIDQDAVDHYKSLNPIRINRADQIKEQP